MDLCEESLQLPIATLKRRQWTSFNCKGELDANATQTMSTKGQPRTHLPAHQLLLRRTDRYVVECVGHVHDEPLQGDVNPKEVLAVFHHVFQAAQNDPFAEGHRGVDLWPQKVPDKPMFRTSVLFVLQARETLEFVQGVEEQAMARVRLSLQQLIDDRRFSSAEP